MQTDDRETRIEALKSNLGNLVYESWSTITGENLLNEKLPDGFSVEITTYYDGGTINLEVGGVQVMRIEREVEYSRLDIDIQRPFQSRSEKLLGLMDRVVQEVVKEQAEIDRQERLRSEMEANAPVLAAIDELPDPFESF
jgi:hypothetical protein